MLPTALNNGVPGSFVDGLRRQRFRHFLSIVEKLPKPVRVLDVGGTEQFWERMGVVGDADLSITLLNISCLPVAHSNMVSLVGDATDMNCIPDKSFDIAFSNSVIEHLGTLENMAKMAAEVRRVARSYYLQTPNRYFPLEPHFVFPGFQFLTLSLQVWLVRTFSLGWYSKFPDDESAEREIRSIRLLSKRDLQELFPEAKLLEERLFGMTKSYTAYEVLSQP